MTGLYIIEKVTLAAPSPYGGIAILSFFLLMILTFVFWGEALSAWYFNGVWWTLALISASCMIIVPLTIYAKVPTYTGYKAILTSELNEEEFYNRYEIISKTHDIYTIKEIEN